MISYQHIKGKPLRPKSKEQNHSIIVTAIGLKVKGQRRDKLIKLQATANKDYEIMDFIHILKLRGADYEVKPPESREPKQTKDGRPIRWIHIKHL